MAGTTSEHRLTLDLPDEEATRELGLRLAHCLTPGLVVYLGGELGAGKTALARAVLRGLGFSGRVKSPTYTLVEVYAISRLNFHHFDFYRFDSPSEFVEAGLGEYFNEESVCFVEWPDKAAGFVPPPDLVFALRVAGDGREIDLAARSARGAACLNCLAAQQAEKQAETHAETQTETHAKKAPR